MSPPGAGPPGAVPPGGPTVPRPHRHREWPFLLVVAAALVAVVVVASGHVKRGTVALGGALLLAALLRLVLPTRDAGLLAVRSRVLDVLASGGLGAAVVVLAVIVPPRR